jgi:hypothetical protein
MFAFSTGVDILLDMRKHPDATDQSRVLSRPASTAPIKISRHLHAGEMALMHTTDSSCYSSTARQV